MAKKEKLTKEEKVAAKKKAKEEGKTLGAEFKKFITRGNVLDMSVGVIMGGAFNAIVTAFTNILLSVCTWAVPGGIKGLVTVLPAANPAQAGLDNIGQKFNKGDLNEMVITYAKNNGVDNLTTSDITFNDWKNALLGNYTLHGATYTYNQSAIIDWGTFINAVISFLVVALTLFVIVKTVNTLKNQREALNAKLKLEFEAKKNGKNAGDDKAEAETSEAK